MELVQIEVSPHTAAKLVLFDEVNLHTGWPSYTTEKILHEISCFDLDELLSLIDGQKYPCEADCDKIPQFGKLQTILSVPYVVLQTGHDMNYAQLGLQLKGDIHATPTANIKYGENHGKGAALLGLVLVNDGQIKLSALSRAYCQIQDTKYAKKIAAMLLFRIPVIRMIIKNARQNTTNGYLPLIQLAESTRRRRAQSIRTILKELRTLNHKELNIRLDRIVWEETEVNDATEV